jgi:hypothetical protein
VDGLTFGVNSKGYRNAVALPSGVVALMQDIRLAKTAGLPDGLAGTLVKLSAQHPAAAGQLLLIKLARSWYATDSGRGERMILLAQLPFIALLLGGLLLAWRRRQLPRPVLATLALIVVYFWAMTTAALSILRYMVPAFGIGFLAAPAAAQALLARYTQYRARRQMRPAQPAIRPEGNRMGGSPIPPAAPTWVPVTGSQAPASQASASRETPAHSRAGDPPASDLPAAPEDSESPRTAPGE